MDKKEAQAEEIKLGKNESCVDVLEFMCRRSNHLESTKNVETVLGRFDDGTDVFLPA